MIIPRQILQFNRIIPIKKAGISLSGIIFLFMAISPKDHDGPTTEDIIQQKTDSLIQFAIHHQGIPYRRGGTTTRGFDCSGFTQHVFREVGVTLNRSAATQFNQGIEINPDQLQNGDLVFFQSGSRINHVGVLVDVNSEESTFIHVSSSRGIRLDNLQNSYYKKHFVGAKRIMLPELFASEEEPS